jgi:uncharacterized Fe-S cluster-containing radical SAM superfamily protein
LFRLCNVYKGGGGYDKFPAIAKKRLGLDTDKQFVVQLKGCPLNCAYCYVTPDGVNGDAVQQTEEDLIKAFISQFKRGVKVFHLMGGAPALYLDRWASIIKLLPTAAVFHSDLMLIERDYSEINLKMLTSRNCLFAVSIKGNNPEEFYEKTKAELNEYLFWRNFDQIVEKKLNFYITFTGINPSEIEKKIESRYGSKVLKDSFTIDLIEYEALKE